MRLFYASEDSTILGRIHILAGHFFRLALAGAVLAGCLYGQPPAAQPVARQTPFLNGNACDSHAESNFLDPRGVAVSRKLWASPFSGLPGDSPNRCHTSLAAELSEENAESVERQLRPGTAPPLGLGSGTLWAWNSQSPPAIRKKRSNSVTSGQVKHIFWVIPAFQVYNRRRFTPLTPREKFDEWAEGAYDPLGLGAGGVEAALEYSPKDGFCGYGKGWGGYGECFGSAELDANVSSFFGDYVFTVLLHQDPRYFRLGEGSFAKRSRYAISRVFVTYTDSGHTTFYTSALGGTALAAGLSNLYYPVQDRGFSLTLSRIGWDLGDTALYNLAAEFWPDIKHRLYHTF